MVDLNLRLFPKLKKRGIMGGTSSNHYLKGNVRKIDMQLIFPKEHWKITEHEKHISVDLLNYTFVAGQLKSDILSVEQKLVAQEANVKKAKDRVKECKSTVRKASPAYKIPAQTTLAQAQRNLDSQETLLREYQVKLEKQNKAKAKKKQKEVDSNGQV